jgi:hypothetical protein
MAEMQEEEETAVKEAMKHLNTYRNILLLLPPDYQRHNKCQAWVMLLREMIAHPSLILFERAR